MRLKELAIRGAGAIRRLHAETIAVRKPEAENPNVEELLLRDVTKHLLTLIQIGGFYVDFENLMLQGRGCDVEVKSPGGTRWNVGMVKSQYKDDYWGSSMGETTIVAIEHHRKGIIARNLSLTAIAVGGEVKRIERNMNFIDYEAVDSEKGEIRGEKERVALLQELLTTEIDKEATQKSYERAKAEGRNPNWIHEAPPQLPTNVARLA